MLTFGDVTMDLKLPLSVASIYSKIPTIKLFLKTLFTHFRFYLNKISGLTMRSGTWNQGLESSIYPCVKRFPMKNLPIVFLRSSYV